MQLKRSLLALSLGLACSAAFAQAGVIQRNENQQQRIEQGLQSGQLNTREAGRLEREESHVDRMEARATRDGQVTPQERARINQAQDRVSRDIYREKHDAQVGNPASPASQRMQADVQRNINQQERIGQGVRSGELTGREAGRLERGEARINRMEARAGRDGHVGPLEQRRLQAAENRESGRIWGAKHNGRRMHD